MLDRGHFITGEIMLENSMENENILDDDQLDNVVGGAERAPGCIRVLKDGVHILDMDSDAIVGIANAGEIISGAQKIIPGYVCFIAKTGVWRRIPLDCVEAWL